MFEVKDGEVYTVGFYGFIPRKDTNGVYYRLNFNLNGIEGSVRSSTNEAGKAGKVRFCKKGSIGPDGNPVHQDCYSLVSITTANIVSAAAETVAALVAQKW